MPGINTASSWYTKRVLLITKSFNHSVPLAFKCFHHHLENTAKMVQASLAALLSVVSGAAAVRIDL